MPESIVHGLEVVEIDEQDRDEGSGSGTARQRVVDPVAEQRAVGQAGQAVVECLVADLLVEPGVVEGDRRRLGQRSTEPEASVLRRGFRSPVQLDGADGLAAGDERQHGHGSHADGFQELDLGRVRVGAPGVDVHVDVLVENSSSRRIVGEVVHVVDGRPTLDRVVAVGQDAVPGPVPVADAAFVGAGRAGQVRCRHVADLARVHRLEHGRGQLDQAAELASGGLQPRGELPEEEQREPEHHAQNHDAEGGRVGGRQDDARRHHRAHDGDEHGDDPGEADEPAQRVIVEIGQDDDDRQQRGDGQLRARLRLHDRQDHDDREHAHGHAPRERRDGGPPGTTPGDQEPQPIAAGQDRRHRDGGLGRQEERQPLDRRKHERHRQEPADEPSELGETMDVRRLA
jgi:hypothetical protein